MLHIDWTRKKLMVSPTGVLINEIHCSMSHLYAYCTHFVRVAASRTTCQKKKYEIWNTAKVSIFFSVYFWLVLQFGFLLFPVPWHFYARSTNTLYGSVVLFKVLMKRLFCTFPLQHRGLFWLENEKNSNSISFVWHECLMYAVRHVSQNPVHSVLLISAFETTI